MSAPAKVAKVKASHHHAPIYPSAWRVYMRHLAKWLLIALVVMTLVPAVVSVALAQARQPKAFDCRTLIAGWHPDVPAHVRIKCRGAA